MTRVDLKMPPQTLSDLPAWGAAHFGQKTALVTDEGNLSFAEIEHRVASVAGGLRSLGITAGSRVVLHLPNSWEWIVAYYAIARVGAAVTPANILLVPREVAFIADDCGATAVIAPADRMEAIKAAGCTSGHLIAVGVMDAKGAGATHWSRLLSDNELIHTGSAEPLQVCTIGYTSGTTGKPKGALLPHRAVVLNTAMTSLMHARTRNDVVLTALPCPHVYGNVVMNGAFLVGYTLVLMRRFDAEEALSLVAQHRVTIVDGVPTMYYYLLGTESIGKADLSSLVRCTVGGQTMPPSHMQEVQSRLRCPLHELWGMTEIAGLGTTHPAHAAPRLGSIGQPMPFTACRVVAIDDPGKVLPAGEIGELMVRGPTVMKGYHGQEAATREAIEPDGWLHTGDLARRDEDGFYFVVDRKKEMIITAGYNIYPSEVERVIAKHPGVQIVAVGAVSDSLKGEAAHAFIVKRPGVAIDERELQEFCRRELAAYKVPKGFHFVGDLPKTSTGKIVRRELSKLLDGTIF